MQNFAKYVPHFTKPVLICVSAFQKLCFQHLKPSTEKIHNYLKKIDKDLQYESFSKIMDQLVQKEFINIQGDGNEESIFVNKSVSDFLRTFNLETKNCETQTDQVKEDCNEHKNKEQDTGKKRIRKLFG